MLNSSAITIAALAGFCGLLLWAAITDWRRFIIPNQVSLGALALYPAFAASAPHQASWAVSLLLAGLFFAIGYGMYTMRAMGAGDAKLLPVVVLWAGPTHLAFFLIVMLASSLVLALVVGLRALALRLRASERSAGVASEATLFAPIERLRRVIGEIRYVPFLKLQVPYGVAIAAGGIAAAIYIAFTVAR